MPAFSGSDGGGRPKPPFLSRLHDRPRLPSELLSMSDDDYRKVLRDSGYGEIFIKAELAQLEEYRERIAPPPPPVAEGPRATPQYDAWARRRRQQATEGGTDDG